KGCSVVVARMLDDAFADFESEIEAGEFKVAVFELFDDTQGVQIMIEAGAVGAHKFVELALAGVAEGRMPDVMDESESFGEFAVEAEGGGNGARDLGDFESVGEAVAKVVGVTRREDLGLGFEAAKSSRVDDAVAIASVFGAVRMARFGVATP